MKKILKSLLYILILLNLALFVHAAEIWTTDIDGNLKTKFAPGSIVYINGQGFSLNAAISIQVTRPDSSVQWGFDTADNSGSFVYEYDLNGIQGIYLVYATDGLNHALTTFSDDAIWTTKEDCGDSSQDVNHFSAGDHVHINGDGFTPSSVHTWSIQGQPGGASCDPGETPASGSVTVNGSGSFCIDAYTVGSDGDEDCGEYQVKLDGVKGDNYRVQGNTCGSDGVQTGEECERPNTTNNNNCGQTTEECLGNLLGIRDTRGDCDESCGCVYDDFVYSCVQGECGAQCDGDEDCDDGNATTSDSCNLNNCSCEYVYVPGCGNGIQDPGEECDDGNQNNFDACRTNCTLPFCGDNILDSGEECDDGNNVNGDGCDENCTTEPEEGCGNGIKEGDEECDDGNGNNFDECRNDCTLPYCGDGIQDPNEECDDGAGNSDTNPDACRTNCTLPECGDGVVDSGEECDDGNQAGGDGCEADCTKPDNCNDACAPNIGCDGSYVCSSGYCRNSQCTDETDCTCPTCGDGTVDPGEQCDDGNNVDGDGCNSQCQNEYCGDGIKQTNEECESDEDCGENELCINCICDPQNPFDFCEQFYCSPDCYRADFLDDEPEKEFPNDCTVVIVHKEGFLYPKCVPLTCIN